MESILGILLFIAVAVILYIKGRKNGEPSLEAPVSMIELKCKSCGAVLNSFPSGSEYGVYGRPLRTCHNCGVKYYNQYYHELALTGQGRMKSAYSFEAANYDKEMSASRRRLEMPGYAVELYDVLEQSDTSSLQALKAFIVPQLKKYTDLLFEKRGMPLAPLQFRDRSLFDRLTYEARDEKAVHQIVNDVLLHYGIKPDIFQVRVEYSENTDASKEGIRGSFARGTLWGGVINVVIKPVHSEYDTVISIVLHECAHAYLALNGISIEDSDENERLTDVAVLFLGGGSYMLRGYYFSRNYRLGYLHKAECEAGMALIREQAAVYMKKGQDEKKRLLSEWTERKTKLNALCLTVRQNMQRLHPARVVREASVQKEFYDKWCENEALLEEAESYLHKIKDETDPARQILEERIELTGGFIRRLEAFSGVLQTWQEAEYWQSNLPDSVMQNIRGVEQLAANGNAYAILERIRFWAACPATMRDAEICFSELQMEETPDSLCALGICYSEGLTVPKDEAIARKYFTRAAEQGCKDAVLLLEKQNRA